MLEPGEVPVQSLCERAVLTGVAVRDVDVRRNVPVRRVAGGEREAGPVGTPGRLGGEQLAVGYSLDRTGLDVDDVDVLDVAVVGIVSVVRAERDPVVRWVPRGPEPAVVLDRKSVV